jgi:restriction system protein
MAKRYRKYKRYSRYKRYRRSDPVPALLALLFLGLASWVYTNRVQIIFYLTIASFILGIAIIVYLFIRKKKKKEGLNFLSDDGILYALKSLTPAQFESEVADIFRKLGYETTVMGGANDGGIDIVAIKNKKKYFIQCKKFITQAVTPHDVRDFLGAITNPKNPAEKGFFVTTGGFTLRAAEAAEGNPRIELISGVQLVRYYRMAHKDAESEEELTLLEEAENQRICPQCGGGLEIKMAQKGKYIGQQFLGCSNYPQCKYIQNI